MGYLEYLRSRLGGFVPFLFAFGLLLGIAGGKPWESIGAALLAVAFFTLVFSTLWLLSAIIGRKPRRQLPRLR